MPAPLDALVYLWSRSLVNLLTTRVQRLRQPKYLLGALLGLGYLYLVFLRPRPARQTLDVTVTQASGDWSALVTTLGGGLLLLMVILGWLWPRGRTALNFSEAEIAWLFPAPVPQRALVHYCLVRNQLGMVFSALLFTLISFRWEFVEGSALNRFAGWWLFMAVYSLHHLASGFMLTRLMDRGWGAWRRALLPLSVLALLVWILPRLDPGLRVPTPRETADMAALQVYFADVLGGSTLDALLWPFRAVVTPFVTTDLPSLLVALVPALCIYALHYAWVVMAEIPNADGALDKAARRAAQVAALRSGNLRLGGGQARARRAPFRLAATGSPLPAFLWKNLMATRGYLRLRPALILMTLIILLNLTLMENPVFRSLTMFLTLLAAMFLVYTALLGPLLARQDLRSDLPNMDLLKTYPLAGWQVVLGELLTPLAVLTGIIWLSLLQIGLSPVPPRLAEVFVPMLRLQLALALGLLLPLLCAIQLVVLNAATLVFPAWAGTLQHQGQHGIEVTGQRMIFFAAQWLVLLLSLVPALLIGAIVYLAAQLWLGVYAILPTALVAAVILAAELAWGLNWLGDRFEAFDLTE